VAGCSLSRRACGRDVRIDIATRISRFTTLSHAFDTKVRVEMGQRKGRIVVEFGSTEDLERIAALMGSAGG